jgi:hypothetical protein
MQLVWLKISIGYGKDYNNENSTKDKAEDIFEVSHLFGF